jgi:hypothetical protein
MPWLVDSEEQNWRVGFSSGVALFAELSRKICAEASLGIVDDIIRGQSPKLLDDLF